MIVKFKLDTGEILYVVDSEDNFDLYAEDNKETEGAIIASTEKPFNLIVNSKYVSDGLLKIRPQNPTTLNNLVLSDVPKGSTIHIDGKAYECENGGEVTLQFNQAGVYAVYVESFPHLDKEFTIDYQP